MPLGPELAAQETTEIFNMPPEGKPAEPAAPGKRRRARRIVLTSLLVLALLAGGGLIAAGLYVRSVESNIERVDAFDEVPEESRPVKVAEDAMNMLVLGSDSRNPDSETGSRTDTIILAHLPKDRSSAQLISIPRDTWVYVPKTKDGKHGGREAKINASFAWGGFPLLIQTVERFTGVRIDHVVIIDFSGFQEIVDALGGVEIIVDRDFTSTHSLLPGGRREFHKGAQTMDGAMTLDYARERYAFADGDFTRIKHQQQVIEAILDKAASGGLLSNPTDLNAFIRATADSVSADQDLSLIDTAMDLRHLRGGNLTFFTSPTTGTGRKGTESVVFADTDKAKTFYDAVRSDSVDEIMKLGAVR